MTDPVAPRRRKKPVRKPAPAAMPVETSLQGPDDRVAAYYETLRTDLVDRKDRGVLTRLAAEHLPSEPDPRPDDAQIWSDTLFGVVRMAADELSLSDQPAAADLFAEYIEHVLPTVRRLDLEIPDVRRELRRLRLVSFMSPEVLSGLQPTAATADKGVARPVPPTPLEVPPEATGGDVALLGAPRRLEPVARPELTEPPAAPEAGSPADDEAGRDDRSNPEAEEPEADDAPAAVKTVEEIIEHCLAAEQQGRKIILVIGLATTGKSFLVRRLKHSLRRDYFVAESRALPIRGAHGVGRTMDVLLYSFTRHDRMSAAENFDLYDIPGDWFSKLLTARFNNVEDNRFFSLIYTIFAFADAIVFLAPAYHVLMPDQFVREGDDDPDLAPNLRRERRDQMNAFIDSLEPMTIAAALLRKEMRRLMPRRPLWGKARRRARADAARAAVEKIGAMELRQILDQRRAAGRLDIPGALLLSRTDEFARRLPLAHSDMIDSFDRDPAHMMLALGLGREYFSHLASRFSAFTADFLTAQENLTFTRTFRAERPSAGVTSFFREWLLPAISACRRPVWLRPLEAPGWALWIRRMGDPSFEREWRRD